MIEFKNPAAPNSLGFLRLISQPPGQVIERHSVLSPEPPPMHRVEDTSNVELRKIHERPNRNVVDEAPLKDERQIETDDVVAYDLVDVGIEASHQLEKFRERLLL